MNKRTKKRSVNGPAQCSAGCAASLPRHNRQRIGFPLLASNILKCLQFANLFLPYTNWLEERRPVFSIESLFTTRVKQKSTHVDWCTFRFGDMAARQREQGQLVCAFFWTEELAAPDSIKNETNDFSKVLQITLPRPKQVFYHISVITKSQTPKLTTANATQLDSFQYAILWEQNTRTNQ
jgi:hypothetical protein